jgi:hypothetical protein
MKLTVLGGGGVRSPFLAKSIAYNAHRIGVTEVVFMDTDREKLAVYGAIAQEPIISSPPCVSAVKKAAFMTNVSHSIIRFWGKKPPVPAALPWRCVLFRP